MSGDMPAARRILANATGLPESAIGDAAAIGTLEAWDSLAHVRILLALEEKIGRPLSNAEIVSITRLSDVAAVAGSRQG